MGTSEDADQISPTALPAQGAEDRSAPSLLEKGVREFSSLWQAARDFLYGLTAYEIVQHALEMRAATENLFLAALFGDLIGLPIMPPFYSLRLLPYVVPQIATWKRRVLRERELSDEHDYHLHGL